MEFNEFKLMEILATVFHSFEVFQMYLRRGLMKLPKCKKIQTREMIARVHLGLHPQQQSTVNCLCIGNNKLYVKTQKVNQNMSTNAMH